MNKQQEKTKSSTDQHQPQATTLMAVQEKLGLFAQHAAAEPQETHQILNKKPLGYI